MRRSLSPFTHMYLSLLSAWRHSLSEAGRATTTPAKSGKTLTTVAASAAPKSYKNGPEWKRIPNAYTMYVKDNLAAMRQKNPGVPGSVIMKLVAAQWKADPNTAAPYVAKAGGIKAEMLAERKLTAPPKNGPNNAFMFYLLQMYKQYSDTKVSEVAKTAGERWRNMPEDEKNSRTEAFKVWKASMANKA